MGGSSDNNSFIPKRGPASRPRRVASKQVYIFTLVSYVVFFATLVAAAGVFLYDRYVDEQLQGEVAALSVEIERFRESDMDEVREFYSRIEYAKQRFNALGSLSSLLTTLENTTAESAQIQNLTVERNADRIYNVTANIQTDTFDSSLFQREFSEQDGVIGAVELNDVSIISQANDEGGAGGTSVSFVASLSVPIAAIPYTATVTSAPLEIQETSTTTDLNDPSSVEDDIIGANQPSV